MIKTHKSQFIYTIVTPKQEDLIKAEMKFFYPWTRFAFSAPGFVTFKLLEDRLPQSLVCALSWGVSCSEAEVDESSLRTWKVGEDGELQVSDSPVGFDECFIAGEKKYFGTRKTSFSCFKAAEKSGIPSRAYYKLAEILKTLNLTISPGDQCIELGSAPGGAVLKMLECEARVYGVDTGIHAEIVTNHENFTPLKVKYQILHLEQYPLKIDWALSDLNLDIEEVLEHRNIEELFSRIEKGFIFTIKLMNQHSIERKEVINKMFSQFSRFKIIEVKVPHHGREYAVVGVKK